MDIITVIQESACATQLKARTKDTCLMELAALVAKTNINVSQEKIYQSFLDREKMGSTGFENGIAIPHCKIEGLESFVAGIAVSKKGIKFDSIDGKKSTLFFTVVGPADQPGEHLKILAQISRIARNDYARRALINGRSPLDLKETLVRYASGYDLKKKESGEKKLLIIVLYEKNFFDDIINLFLENGIRGANVFDSGGIREQLMNIPLYSSFLDFLGGQSDTSKTILVTVPEDDVNRLVSGIEELTGDLDNHTGACIMVLDLHLIKGTLET